MVRRSTAVSLPWRTTSWSTSTAGTGAEDTPARRGRSGGVARALRSCDVIDVRRLRTEPDQVRAALARRHLDLGPLDRAVELDRRLRELAGERDAVRARVRVLSKEVGQARRSGDHDTVTVLSSESRALGEREGVLDREVAA